MVLYLPWIVYVWRPTIALAAGDTTGNGAKQAWSIYVPIGLTQVECFGMVDRVEPFVRAQQPGDYLANHTVVASVAGVGISPGCVARTTVFQDHEVAPSGVDFIAQTQMPPSPAVYLTDLHTAHLDEGEPEYGIFYGSEDIAGWWARSGSGRRGIVWPENESPSHADLLPHVHVPSSGDYRGPQGVFRTAFSGCVRML